MPGRVEYRMGFKNGGLKCSTMPGFYASYSKARFLITLAGIPPNVQHAVLLMNVGDAGVWEC